MGIYKERILPIRLIRKRHLLSHLILLRLAHALQSFLIDFVQMVVIPSQAKDDKDQCRQRCNNADLPRLVPWRLLLLKGLCSQYVPHGKGDESQCVRRDLLRVARDVGSIPSEQQHEGRAERTREEGSCEEAAFVLGDAVGVEADHQAARKNGGDDDDNHHQ